MRNQMFRQGVTSFQAYYKSEVSGKTKPSGGQVTGSYQSLARWQGDLVRSDGIKPTAYSAFRYEAKALSCELESNRYYMQRYDGKWELSRRIISGTYAPRYYRLGAEEGDVTGINFPIWTENAAITRALNRVNDNKLDLGQYLGELSRSSVQVVSGIAQVMRAYRQVKAGNVQGALTTLGIGKFDSRGKRLVGRGGLGRSPATVANTWLAMKFGWLPLLEESYTIIKGITRTLNGPDPFSVKVVVTDDNPSKNYALDRDHYVRSGTFTKGTEVKMVYGLSDADLAFFNSVGLINPLSLTWELLPNSFVIDYFLPIGNFLSGLSSHLGLEFKYGYKTRFAKADFEVGRKISGYSGKDPATQVKVFGMRRFPLFDFPQPRLTIPPALNASQMGTLGAMFAQRGGK